MSITITFAGNLAADPELRFTPGGHAVAEMRVGVNRRVQNDQEEWVDAEPTFYPVKVWGKPAENIAESVARGDRVLVHGTVETEAWTDRETNQKRTRDVVVVNERNGEIATSTKYAIARPEKPSRATTSNQTSQPTSDQA